MTRFLKAPFFVYLLGIGGVCFVRLLPFRPPNMEPLFATLMPMSQRFGPWGGFLFGTLSISLFDALTSGWGIWTLITAIAYGLLGSGSHWYLLGKDPTRGAYVRYTIVGTLFYDALTGLTIGPLLWGQSLEIALVGQIPFTLMHLAGNVTLAALVSPVLYRFMVPKHRAQTLCGEGAKRFVLCPQ